MSESISPASPASRRSPDARLNTAPMWLKVLLALLSGSLFFLISPMTIEALQWAAWVPLFAALGSERPRRDFFLGWLGGAALCVAGFYWIVQTITVFSNLPLPAALFALFAFAAYGGLPYGFLGVAVPRLRAAFGQAAILIIPALWVTLEYLFPVIFPYHQGDLQYRFLPVMQLGSITGVYGVSFLIMASNSALFELLEAARGRVRWPVVPSLVVGAAIAASIGWGAWRVQHIDQALAAAPKARLGLIQGNFGVEERRITNYDLIFDRYKRLTDQAIQQGATLIIWGEGSSPYSPLRGWKKLEAYQRSLGIDMIVGAAGKRLDGSVNRHTNSAYALHRDSEEVGRYDKNVLLAFGEYLPGSETFPSWKGKITGIGDYVPGRGGGLFSFHQPQGEVRALMLICYEAILNRFVLDQAAGGDPNLLVNITHDAWFGNTAAPHQFLMLVTSRAIELGTSVARVANTGITCMIDPTGRIRDETPLFQQAVLVEDVALTRFPTLYRTIGDTFALLCGLATVVAVALYRRRRGGLKGNDVA